MGLHKLKPNESFCCNNGCGVCDALRIWDTYSESISPCGTLRETKDQLIHVSTCCRIGVFVWDNEKDEETPYRMDDE
jgi:hypothetical protein